MRWGETVEEVAVRWGFEPDDERVVRVLRRALRARRVRKGLGRYVDVARQVPVRYVRAIDGAIPFEELPVFFFGRTGERFCRSLLAAEALR
jgi:hypothetical protein